MKVIRLQFFTNSLQFPIKLKYNHRETNSCHVIVNLHCNCDYKTSANFNFNKRKHRRFTRQHTMMTYVNSNKYIDVIEIRFREIKELKGTF